MAAVLPRECHVHPVVLFSIVDSYERRNDKDARVIGTLLGTNIQGIVEITNCFCVPHNESADEVAVDMEFAKNMYDLHKKVNANESIIGWYATRADSSDHSLLNHEISDHSLLIHEYYSRECTNPVHLTIDTTLTDFKLSTKVWIRQTMGVPDKSKGTIFTPIKMVPVCHQPERVGLDTLIRGQASGRRTMETVSDLQHVGKASAKLQEMIAIVLSYVDEVMSGKIPADNQIGRFLMDLVANVPKLEPEEFERMINSNMKDLLMVVYLSNLVETQLNLNEKLTLIAQTHP